MQQQFRFLFVLNMLAATQFFGVHAAPVVTPLETERLYLRQVALSDAADIAEIALNPEVTRSTGLFPPVNTIEDVEKFIVKFLIGDSKNNNGPAYPLAWAMVEKQSGKVTGLVTFVSCSTVHLRAELGYAASPLYWNKGYMTEACKAIITYMQGSGIVRIQATADPVNVASQRVLEKLGMKLEGILRSYMVVQGERRDRNMYALVS